MKITDVKITYLFIAIICILNLLISCGGGFDKDSSNASTLADSIFGVDSIK